MALSVVGIILLVALLVAAVFLAIGAFWLGVNSRSGLGIFFLVLGLLGIIALSITLGFLGT